MNTLTDTRFSDCLDSEKIRTKVTVRPEPVSGLESLDPLIAAELLESTLKQIFIPNQFSLAFIKEMVGRASLHSQQLFSSEAQYSARVFNPPEVEVSPLCLTGLAGIGKSQTIAALRKVLPQPTELSCDLYQGTVPLLSHWYASARGKASGKVLLENFVFGDNPKLRMSTVAILLKESRRAANKHGVSLTILEEMQHISTGSGAAMVTDILLTMAAIGPPMVFVCNYSLAHKLLKRNSEDTQRLLAAPRLMLPEEPNSQDWIDYIAECLRVSNGYISADIVELAKEVYRCTFGIKRLVTLLLKLAYVECRSAGRQSVNVIDILNAYRSTTYTVSAGQVEELQYLAIGGRPKKAQLHLVCPFDVPEPMKSNVVKFTRDDRHQRVISKVFDSALTEHERAAQKSVDVLVQTDHQLSKKHRSTSLIHLSAEDQASAFFEYIDMVAPPKPTKPK